MRTKSAFAWISVFVSLKNLVLDPANQAIASCTLDHEQGAYVISVETPVALDLVILHSAVHIDLLDSDEVDEVGQVSTWKAEHDRHHYCSFRENIAVRRRSKGRAAITLVFVCGSRSSVSFQISVEYGPITLHLYSLFHVYGVPRSLG